jgi:Icc-related predicted phosphoesterase
MRFLAFTDFHGNLEAFHKARQAIADEKPDLVLVAGDIANHNVEKAKGLLADLGNAGSPVYFVPGNMDGFDLLAWLGNGNVHGLHGRCEYWGDIPLIGLGGSPHGAFSTPIEYSEEVAAETLDRALRSYHDGSLVLVSQCPPRDTKIDRVIVGQHVSSVSVRKFIEKTAPALVVSGHVHEAQGHDKIGPTTLVNPGPAKSGNYARINLSKSLEVNFAKFK